MQHTTNFNLNTVEGTDLFNPLTQMNPNWETIDEVMKDNQSMGVTEATHTKTGTLNALVRETAGVPIIRFTATGDYRVGDTFTVDGQSVNARLPDGTSLPDYAFRVNSNIIAIQAGGVLTIVTNGATIDTNAFMRAADYVGSGATGKVKSAETADVATQATNATNATNLNGNPSTYYASAASVSGIIQNITAISLVSELPANPVATVLYLVTE